jgi:glyoxylase-like metal-dependent hydrolase (beta-lactamase superfamily II)
MNTRAALLLAAVLVLGSVWIGSSQNAPPRPAATLKVRDDLFMISGGGGNVAAYITDEGVILVDDMYERDAPEVLAKLKTLTDKPVKYVFNTHQHSDHAGGNTVLLPIAEVIAHRNARANMAALKQPGLPRITFSSETAIFLGGKEARAGYYGRGHTGGDAFVYFP